MAWGRTVAGREYSYPSSERGVHVDGPLTVEDWKRIINDIVEEMVEQARREAKEGSG